MSFRVGIDTGGTFTDAVSVDEKGNLVYCKTPTTPKDLPQGTMNAIRGLAKNHNMDLKEFMGQVLTIVHGTTQGTNVIIARSGPKLGLITTEGHTDCLRLRRVIKENMWDWRLPFPEPLVPRYLCVGVKERVDSNGNISQPLNEDSVREAVAYLKKMKVQGIVVSLLWSFQNPQHELEIQEIIQQEFPEAHITLSHKILPQMGEYERTSTAVISAYTAPSTASYIKRMTDFLADSGFKGQFLFMQNNGGVETAEIGVEKSATLATSGPAAGPPAALVWGSTHGKKNLLSVDMGGTSFDIAIIDNGQFITKTESLISEQRFSLPVIDVDSVGAGGGSIAWFDASGTLHMGPQSAAADPGPACYGIGGEEATTTDAYVVLGYLNPEYFLGGQLKLNRSLAEKAIKEKVAARLNISVPEAAYAMFKINNSVMADGITHSFTKRGYDPRDFVMVAAGAAGPVGALKIAEDIGISTILVPKVAANFCAFGMLVVDLRHDFTRFYHTDRTNIDINKVEKLYQEMESEGIDILRREGVQEKDQVLIYSMQVRYWGQFRDISVSWPGNIKNLAAIEEGIKNFHRRHKEIYGFSDEKYPIEVMGFSLSAIGKMHEFKPKKIKQGIPDASGGLKGEREAYFEETKGFTKTKIYDGDKLLGDNVIEGPAIIEETTTTVVIPPGFKVIVDDYGNYITA